MIACFGSVAHAPIAVMLMVAEMTGNLELLAPAMVAVGLATLIVGDATIYTSQIKDRVASSAHRIRFGLPLLASLPITKAMRPLTLALNPDCSSMCEGRCARCSVPPILVAPTRAAHPAAASQPAFGRGLASPCSDARTRRALDEDQLGVPMTARTNRLVKASGRGSDTRMCRTAGLDLRRRPRQMCQRWVRTPLQRGLRPRSLSPTLRTAGHRLFTRSKDRCLGAPTRERASRRRCRRSGRDRPASGHGRSPGKRRACPGRG